MTRPIDPKVLELLNLKQEDFEAKPGEDKDRLSDLEDAVIELAGIISEVME